MERGEVQHGVGNGLDSGHGVSNGLDRGRVDVVVDGVDMPTRKCLPVIFWWSKCCF